MFYAIEGRTMWLAYAQVDMAEALVAVLSGEQAWQRRDRDHAVHQWEFAGDRFKAAIEAYDIAQAEPADRFTNVETSAGHGVRGEPGSGGLSRLSTAD